MQCEFMANLSLGSLGAIESYRLAIFTGVEFAIPLIEHIRPLNELICLTPVYAVPATSDAAPPGFPAMACPVHGPGMPCG